MPRVSRAKARALKKQRTNEAKKAGAMLGAFSTSDAAGYVRALIREEGKRLGKGGEGMTPSQRSIIIGRMAKLVDQLGQVTGETLTVDERRFLKSPAGQRVVNAITGALEKWPAAMLSVADALEGLE